MALIGTTTANAQKKTALPWPTAPYAGSSPLTGLPNSPGTSPAVPTTSPTTVMQGLQNTTSTVDQAKTALNSENPILDNYLTPNSAGTTPFRQALTNTKATSTANAYDNAVSQTRNRAVASGFASNPQPITFGAEAGLQNERAKAIADIPSQVNLEAQPVEFQAAQMKANQAPVLNALANTQQGQTNTLAAEEAARNAQKASLAGGLATATVPAVGGLIKSALAKTAPAAVGAATAPAALSAFAPAAADAALAGTAATAGTAAATAIPSGLAATDAAAAPVLGSVTGGGGLGSTLAGLATNPITIGIAGALAGLYALHKSQVHPQANEFVQKYQDPFGQDLGKVVDGFDQALASGQLDKATAQQVRDHTAEIINQFKQKTNEFAQQGSHQNTVAHQAAATMAANFGPNWEKILGKMDASIAGLA